VSGAVVDALIAEHPDWTPRRLHDAIAPPTADVVRPTEYEPEGVGNGVPMPASVKAQIDAALGRNRNRDNGEGG
jgi:hypothetical protein